MEYGFLLIQSAEWIRRSHLLGIHYSKHSRTKDLWCCYKSTKLSKEVYKNIIKFGLHRATVKTLVLPCSDVIEWITRKIDHENRSILNYEHKSVASYKAFVFNQMHHLKESHIKVTLEWLKQKSEFVYLLTILKGWWFEGHFRTKFAAAE